MDEEYSESDIPTVLIRSKADCPVQEVGPYSLYASYDTFD